MTKITWATMLLFFSFTNAVFAADGSTKNGGLPTGEWRAASNRAQLSFFEPSMYRLDIDGDGRPETEGTVLLEGGSAVFHETTSSSILSGCNGSYGVYTLSIKETPQLALIKDSCRARAQVLTQPWGKLN